MQTRALTHLLILNGQERGWLCVRHPAGNGVAERGNPWLLNVSRPLVDSAPGCLAMLGLMLFLSPPTHMRARAIKHDASQSMLEQPLNRSWQSHPTTISAISQILLLSSRRSALRSKTKRRPHSIMRPAALRGRLSALSCSLGHPVMTHDIVPALKDVLLVGRLK